MSDFFPISQGISEYNFTEEDVRRDLSERYGFDGDLAEIYSTGSAQLIHKWHHYLQIYDRYFSSWRGKPVRFLEIGVSMGGSLSMWRKYFGDDAVIFGIDIDEACRQYDRLGGSVRIGSQDDPSFLRDVVRQMGGVDIVLDDGSHVMRHMKTSLETLLPLLEDKGIYMIEDLHTAYWQKFGGGFWRRGNFFNYVRDLTDDMHHWYHVRGKKRPNVSNHCGAIHIHDSICVIEKSPQIRPTHSKIQSTSEPSVPEDRSAPPV